MDLKIADVPCAGVFGPVYDSHSLRARCATLQNVARLQLGTVQRSMRYESANLTGWYIRHMREDARWAPSSPSVAPDGRPILPSWHAFCASLLHDDTTANPEDPIGTDRQFLPRRGVGRSMSSRVVCRPKCARQDSNLQPSDSKSVTLSVELRAPEAMSIPEETASATGRVADSCPFGRRRARAGSDPIRESSPDWGATDRRRGDIMSADRAPSCAPRPHE